MARKRQLTKEDRQTIITLKSVGLSLRENCKEAKASVSTVSYTIKRHLETGGNSDRKRSGRPKATTQTEDKFLRVNNLCDRRLTGQQLQAQLNTGRSKEVLVSTVKRRLRAEGLTGRVAVRKQLLRWQNKKKRIAGAMKHHQWTTENWKKVLWTDESKFEIFGPNLDEIEQFLEQLEHGNQSGTDRGTEGQTQINIPPFSSKSGGQLSE